MSRNWTREQAAGIVANLDVETSGTFDPSAVGDNGTAYGIAQWRGSRQRDFERWAGQPLVGSSFQQQLEFVQYELTQGQPLERRAGARLRNARTAADAAAIVDEYYERSNGQARARRINLANQYVAGEITQTGGRLAAEGTDMSAADQARARAGQQVIIVPGQSSPVGQQNRVSPRQSSSMEVPLRIRLERQVA
jgi:hypothetical protein